jgi:hypothetical protein
VVVGAVAALEFATVTTCRSRMLSRAAMSPVAYAPDRRAVVMFVSPR